MMKALTHNIRQEREDQRDRSAQLFMWCIVVSMHQDDGIGASRLLRACNEMDAFEKKYQTAILYGSSKNATDAMRENLKGICDFEVRLPVDRAPRGRREEQLRMASNQGAEIAWLVMAATCHETFGYGRDRLARLKQNSMNNYKQYLEWEKEDKDLALDRLRRCVQDALKEDLRVTDTDDRKGMLSTPGRGPSIYETAAVYSEIFRRARAARRLCRRACRPSTAPSALTAKTPSSPKLWRKCRNSLKPFVSSKCASSSTTPHSTGRRRKCTRTSRRKPLMFSSCWCSSSQFLTPMSW